MIVPNEGEETVNEELKRAVESLDQKFQALAGGIVGMEDSEKTKL
jgi:hypothetical protein